MRYDIQPLRITGSDQRGRTSAKITNKRLDAREKNAVEKILRSIADLDSVSLTTTLAISLEAKVLRNLKPGQEIVRLSNGGKSIDLRRDCSDNPGDIGVSCDHRGDEVPVWSLNIKFRDYDDDCSDRGLVWVFPGDPTTMNFIIKAPALKTPGMVAEIITAAEEAVKTKILARF